MTKDGLNRNGNNKKSKGEVKRSQKKWKMCTDEREKAERERERQIEG